MTCIQLNNPSALARSLDSAQNKEISFAMSDDKNKVLSPARSQIRSSSCFEKIFKREDIQKRENGDCVADSQTECTNSSLLKVNLNLSNWANMTKVPEKHKKRSSKVKTKRPHVEDSPPSRTNSLVLKDFGYVAPNKKPCNSKEANGCGNLQKEPTNSEGTAGKASTCLPVSDSASKKLVKRLSLKDLNRKIQKSNIENEPMAYTTKGLKGKSSCVADHRRISNSSCVISVEERSNHVKVYCRKNCKKPLHNSDCMGSELIMPGEDGLYSNSGCLAHSLAEKMSDCGRSSMFDIPTGKDIAKEARELCISTLLNHGLLGCYPKTIKVEPPGAVGNVTNHETCKICTSLVDSRSWICDLCGKTFHISCCKPSARIKMSNDWYCSTCWNTRRTSIGFPSKCKIESKYEYFLRQIWNNNGHYTSQVRIGTNYQADVPDCPTSLSKVSDSRYLGEVVSTAEVETNLWTNDRELEDRIPPGSQENWLQCRAVLVRKGGICLDGQKAKADIICGKWRRAPTSVAQTEKWECSCAVLWDPYHADCCIPQEVDTSEIEKWMKECRHK